MLTPQKWEVIAGRYRLVREIARGGMGSVWEGEDNKLKRKVAIKLVAPELHEEADAQAAHEQFEREAMAVAKLQSPHVVQIFDYGVERECPFIVMELLEGEDLRSRLHRSKRLSLEMAAVILVQTAKALSVAHAGGIVHRDLKPGNIFLVRAAEEEIVKVLDFGVAMQATDLLEQEGETPVLGTPQFMSPEQARGLANLDHRADLWSLGVIVYKALTGRLPFTGGSPTDVIVRVCTADPEPVSKLAPDLPRELDAFFAKALSRDRRNRFSSAREMALAFSRISPITFTTLSMPDPAAIEEAIAAARASAAQAALAASDDEEEATVAVDPATVVRVTDDELEDDLKTSLVLPKAALPKPKLPPRRSSRSGSSAPPSGPPKVVIAGAEDSDPLTLALDYEDDLPTSVPPVPPTSSPVLLTKTPTPSSSEGLNSDTPPAVVGKSRGARPSSPAPTLVSTPPPKRGTRNTLLLAALAALLGVGIAFVGTRMTTETREIIGELPSGSANTGSAPAAAPEANEEPTEDVADFGTDSSLPAASSNEETAKDDTPAPRAHVRPRPSPASRPRTQPEPASPPAPTEPEPRAPDPEPPAPKPTPKPPRPVPKPPPRKPPPPPDDPFAERL
jgi:serine/threonine-protein kinase